MFYKHIELDGVHFVDVPGVTLCDPAQLIRMADELKQAAEELEDLQDATHCEACNGSGEGRADGTRCAECGGSGEVAA